MLVCPSCWPSEAPWHDNKSVQHLPCSNINPVNLPLREQIGTQKYKDSYYWTTAGAVTTVVRGRHKEEGELHLSRVCINEKLKELAAVLSGSKGLDEFSLETSTEWEDNQGPRWDYLHGPIIRSLIFSLPPCLKNLTLHLGGSRTIAPDDAGKTDHLCPLIAQRLGDF